MIHCSCAASRGGARAASGACALTEFFRNHAAPLLGQGASVQARAALLRKEYFLHRVRTEGTLSCGTCKTAVELHFVNLFQHAEQQAVPAQSQADKENPHVHQPSPV